MASSPLQEVVFLTTLDGIITAYDASSSTALARFTGSRAPRKGLVVGGNNLIVASHVSSDITTGSIHLYTWWSSAPSHHIPMPEPVGPLATTFDGSYLFAGGVSGNIHALSLPSGDIIRSFFAHRKPVSCLAINDDGSLLFSGGDDGTIAVFPIYKLLHISPHKPTQLVLHRFVGHDSTVTSIVTGFGASNCTIISCSLDCTIKFWSFVHGTHLHTVTFPCTIWGVEMDPTESEYFVAGSDGSVYNGTLKGQQGQKLVAWACKHGGPIIDLALINSGRNLITASEDGSVWIWEVSRKQVIRVLGEEMGSISDLVVFKWSGEEGGRHGLGPGEGNNDSGRWSWGFASNELRRPIREVMEMEKVLGVLEEGRSRAIETLGSAIETYERFLERFLKEAKFGNNCERDGNEQEDDS
ncbi:hypothetical protein Acr_17g0006360 [Actinidia rufa]|uniref:Transducin/WD40 repeat-like superfamily protein n=1 Tax=Actinidia rufa TaxID=165716 RepID=A0A7J0G2Q4_9ERIC|nr:hypothetical protein Acr_17g0006360 [Actinidia rufa]